VVKRPGLFIGAAFVVSAALLLRMIDLHAVNVLFYDQFDFLQPLMHGAGQWRLFSLQHGPIRLGLGSLFIEAVYRLSRWDTRVEGFATAGIYFVSVGVALLLKRRAVGPLTWMDLIIPALILSRSQWEILVVTPDAAHGPIPLLLILAAPFCWEIRNAALRVAAWAALAFACAFTGFALLFVPCLAALFAMDLALPRQPIDRLWAACGLACCGAALAVFSVGYHFAPAVDCYQFPAAHPLDYLPFSGLVLLRPWGPGRLVHGAIALGILVLAAGAAFVVLAGLRALKRDRTLLSRTVFLLAACSLSFAANAAVGRVCLGLPSAFASRYAAYVLPLWLAGYFAAAAELQRRPALRYPLGAAVLAGVAMQWSFSNRHPTLRYYSEGKSRWRACYLARHDEAACDAEAHFRVYPVEGAPQVTEMLRYLREHHLNLYKDTR
jgi:hypothetical protein